MLAFTKRFQNISLADLPVVGGKNASLGELITQLQSKGINVPDGFATTADAFWFFLAENNLGEPIRQLIAKLDREKFSNLKEIGATARAAILKAKMPQPFIDAILEGYSALCGDQQLACAVRSSATAEDLPQASFAGQHESYLNIQTKGDLLEAVQKCFASLYTDRAIKYREDNGFAHEKVALSVGVQIMVRSDKGSSGVAFTLEPESGFTDVIHISGVWGLGENIVQGTVTPDEFLVFKPTLHIGKEAILQKRLGDKLKMMVYASADSDGTVTNVDTPKQLQQQYVLNDGEIKQLANWCLLIEEHYGKPMDVEWAKDGLTGQIFIIQARPETVQSARNKVVLREYKLTSKGEVLISGQAIGSKVAVGRARILQSPSEAGNIKEDEIVVTELTSPDWDPVLKNLVAIVTNKGGRTSHASIVARELGVPAIVGCDNATTNISDGEWITVSCCEGKTGLVYKGKLPFEVVEIDFGRVKKPLLTKAMLIVADPEKAFPLSFFPNDGVGLLRMEFIITHFVQVHPMALVDFAEVKGEEEKMQIKELTRHFADKRSYFVEKLAHGIATIAAAFYPKDVIVRMSDFKTNEYANLLGGKAFEPKEENPMLGFRGASRYYHPLYKDGFALECAAIKRVRE